MQMLSPRAAPIQMPVRPGLPCQQHASPVIPNHLVLPCTQPPKPGQNVPVLPYLSPAAIEKRRRALGMHTPVVHRFAQTCEFVSLGSFCGVAQALKALDLHKFSYPFDWVRSNVSSIIHCLDCEFEDFFEYKYAMKHPRTGHRVFAETTWGGSFWHHNPDDETTRSDFERRIARFYGSKEVPADKTRVFCISLNSLSDITSISELRAKLEELFDSAEVYFIVFIDYQSRKRVLHVEDDQKMVFALNDRHLFENEGRAWTEAGQAQAYAEGIATAIGFWAEDNDEVDVVKSITSLVASCRRYEGTNPGVETFWPFPVAAPLSRCGSKVNSQSGVLDFIFYTLFGAPSCSLACDQPVDEGDIFETMPMALKALRGWGAEDDESVVESDEDFLVSI